MKAARRHMQEAGVSEKSDLPRLAIHPGSAVPNRRWPEPAWADLCNRFVAEKIAQPILLQGPAEKGLAERICQIAGIRFPVLSQLENVPVLAAAMLQTDLFVGHSTGTLQVAFLLGLPTVSLWGVSDPAVWGPPWDVERHVIVRSPVPSAPEDDVLRRHEILPCMEAISVDTVMRAVVRQIENRKTSA